MWRATALFVAVGCGSAVDDTAVVLSACEGGGEPSVSIGSGGMNAFDALADGDTITVGEDTVGTAGFRLELSSVGLDTAESVTAVIGLTFDGQPKETYLAQLALQCDEGPGWVATFAPLPDALIGTSVDGMGVDLEASITDARGVSATTSLMLTAAE